MKIIKMRVVKTLPKFAVIYLHNPFKCIDCKESNQCFDDFMDGEAKTALKEKKTSKGSSKISRTLVLVKDSSLEEKPSKITPKRTKPSKRVGKLKNRSIKNIARVLSVIKRKRNQEKSKKKRVNKCKNSLSHAQNQGSKPKTEKCDDQKPPGKGTLKRKRWFLDKLNTSNENYEDDIFENEKFHQFQDLIEDETDSIEKYENIKTPQLPFSISPKEESPSPIYQDCYSPTELTESRKGAEEYRFRRGKMKKVSNMKRNDKKPKSENKPDVQRTLEAVVEILNKTQKMLDKPGSDSDEDSYFPDLFSESSHQSCC